MMHGLGGGARIVAVTVAALLTGCRQSPPTLDIATTTSVQNSGLLAVVVPAVEQATGVTLRVHAAGSGRALQMLDAHAVDAVISHAPAAEARLLAGHPDWFYRKLAHNRFVMVGPAADPARIHDAPDGVTAFQRIADSAAAFVSRGDESGTHERENAFWEAAGRRPAGARLIVSGRGMAQALRHADEAAAYTLTDVPTFRQIAGHLELQVLFDAGDQLTNTYAVLHRNDRPDAAAFAAWLLSDAGRTVLGAFLVDGQRGFEPWPKGCASGKPTDVPCRGASQDLHLRPAPVVK